MRLLTAIPLLFWASTSAMAQLAVLWATEPAAAVTHASSPDAAVESARPDADFGHFTPAPVHPAIATEIVPLVAEHTNPAQPSQPEAGLSPIARLLAASRLLANPPPFGV